jgi:hypothetical protein
MPGEDDMFGAFDGMTQGRQNIPILGNVVSRVGGNPTTVVDRVADFDRVLFRFK